MTNIQSHVISDDKFEVRLDDASSNCPVLEIKIGQAEFQVFFHYGSVDRALLDIDTAIRAFLDNRK